MSSSLVFLTLLSSLFIYSTTSSSTLLRNCGIKAIYNMGDSLTDTGNSLVEFPNSYQGRFPYGMTIHQATGRFSDGLLFIDHIAEAVGLPHLNPSLNKTLDHSKGANFAVGGVGLLSKQGREKWNIHFDYSNSSVDVQLQWLEQLLDLHNFKDEDARRDHLKSSLFLLGGGGNDYGNKTVQQKIALMPDMMAAISSYIKKLILSFDATKVVVFGLYQGDRDANYVNSMHNERLQQELQKLQDEYRHVQLVYGDLWGAFQFLMDNYDWLGYKHSINEVCCGDWDLPRCAPSPSIPYCRNPNEYWFWDTLHFTSFTHLLLSTKIIPQISDALGCGCSN